MVCTQSYYRCASKGKAHAVNPKWRSTFGAAATSSMLLRGPSTAPDVRYAVTMSGEMPFAETSMRSCPRVARQRSASYHDPSTAQFLSRDPAVNLTKQPYAYAGDNPVNNADRAMNSTSMSPDAQHCDRGGSVWVYCGNNDVHGANFESPWV